MTFEIALSEHLEIALKILLLLSTALICVGSYRIAIVNRRCEREKSGYEIDSEYLPYQEMRNAHVYLICAILILVSMLNQSELGPDWLNWLDLAALGAFILAAYNIYLANNHFLYMQCYLVSFITFAFGLAFQFASTL